ncbi:hypothetical protein C9J48_04415 [Photobacterium profundum]|uniref:Uncharacterized protein n=1 Tax=Photobacterium profundum 3TCK TaxID=314280 RepID=Q1Z7N2_9GAMM|nr:hypothetical protein [Photobacterium profundum]EAS44427.1 hypothetical protein P3TCK_14760 [Photobacterium profundum 3TCK]PSV64702.1 hypothetical protein C9J48_04415 [Photobacterium profundum]
MGWLHLVWAAFLFTSFSALSQVYPSTATGWVLPGVWEEPLATSVFDSAKEVKEWEVQHADVVFGSLDDVALNLQTIAMGYMYTQKFDCRPEEKTAWLNKKTAERGIDVENAYLHYLENTVLSVPSIDGGMDYLLKGQPLHLLLIRDGNLSTARPPLSLKPSDEIILISSYPFDQFEVVADTVPSVMRSVAGDDGNIAKWTSSDTRWIKRKNTWQGEFTLASAWLSSFPFYQDREMNTGLKVLSSGLKIWALKLNWPAGTTLSALSLKPWIEVDNNTLSFPGWDDQNDRNHDGFINEIEYSTRGNLKASARFKHQARLIPASGLWRNSCWYRTNFNRTEINDLYGDWYHYDWQRQGLSGAYNDDMAKLLGENQFTLITGGQIAELPFKVGNDEAAKFYAEQMADFLQIVKIKTGTRWLAANISELNLWEYTAWPAPLRDIMDVWLREHYLSPGMGLDRMQRSWDSFALAKLGDKSLIMATTRGGRSENNFTSSIAWHKDIETGLALYYFFNLPKVTYYHSWNQTFIYGSNNTQFDNDNHGSSNWYRQGIPKNWAYQPTKMLDISIGYPSKIPKGYKPVYWKSKQGKAKTTETKLLVGQEKVSLHKANWFWLYRSGWVSEFPNEGVMARQYSGGLVVYRASKERNQVSYFNSKPLRVSLPGVYRRVNRDGSLSAPMHYIELNGYEGAVLKRVR